MKTINITIFCGSKIGKSALLIKEIETLAELLSNENLTLIYGGSKYGIMGLFADRFLEKGRKVIGIRYENQKNETVHPNNSELIIAENLPLRKEKLIEMSDIILVLPGGFGTLDELFEVLSQYKKFKPKKLIIVFNTVEYFKHLQLFLEDLYLQKFIKLKDKNAVNFCNTFEEVVQLCKDFENTKQESINGFKDE